MSNAHVCDNCMTVAPIDEAAGWWKLEALEPVIIHYGEKAEYHFCGKACVLTKLERETARSEA